MIGILIALLSGVLMSIQGVFNTGVTKGTSLWVSAGWVQLTAFLVCIAGWLWTGRASIGGLWQIEHKYMLLGGVIGTFITLTVIKSIASLGPAKSAMLIVIAQITMSYLLELLGIFGVEKQPFSIRKIIGVGIAVVGIIIFK